MIRLVSLLIVCTMPLVTTMSSAQAGDRPLTGRVRVAAASDLKFAFDEVVARLRAREPSIRVEPVYGSSGTFHAQLRQRAPFDLFLSADAEYPRDLVAGGVGSERDVFVYAVGKLVVWVPKHSTLAVERQHAKALVGARRIAIANPRHAPYGRAAEAALRNAGIWPLVQHKLVLGENIAQTAQFVQSGAADAGLLAKSLVVTPAMQAVGRYWDIPEDQYPPLIQGGLVLPWASSRAAAERIRDYLLGEEGRALLAAFGFGLPQRSSTGSTLLPEFTWVVSDGEPFEAARSAKGLKTCCRRCSGDGVAISWADKRVPLVSAVVRLRSPRPERKSKGGSTFFSRRLAGRKH